MAKNIFEELGKEIDSIFNEGIEVLKEVEDSLTKAIDEENLEEKFADFAEFMKDISKDLESSISEIGKDIIEEKSNVSKKKTFNIKVSNIEDIVIKYSKKQNSIHVKKDGVDRVFKIALKEGISKKKVEKILENITFDLKTSLITIIVKRKDLKKD